MRIVHLCLCGPYTDGLTYQDNLLPKHHKLLGNDVCVVTSCLAHDKNGQIIDVDPVDYVNSDGVRVIRLPFANGLVWRKLRLYRGLRSVLDQINPEFMFIHGVQSLTYLDVAKYLNRHPSIFACVDNHVDENLLKGWASINIAHRLIWPTCARKLEKCVDCFFGVTPSRVSFLASHYGVNPNKCKLLIMGLDDEIAAPFLSNLESAEKALALRRSLEIKQDAVLIATGGKIDSAKTQVLRFMESLQYAECNKVTLIIFGSIDEEYKQEFDSLAKKIDCRFLGWIDADEALEVFNSADLVAFPGRHSVYWEEAAGLGKPLLLKKIEGYDHLDFNGNVSYFKDESPDGYWSTLSEVIQPDVLGAMSRRAQEAKGEFLYSQIAAQSLRETREAHLNGR